MRTKKINLIQCAKAISTSLIVWASSAFAAEPSPVSDLAIAMRYDEICSAFDRTSNDKAIQLLEKVQRLGIDMSRLQIDDVSKINYGRGLVDGFHQAYTAGNGYRSACNALRRELIDKL